MSDQSPEIQRLNEKIEDLNLQVARCKLTYVGAMLVISLLWMLIAFLQDQGDGTWFARSGSIPTIAAALASIWLESYRKSFEGVAYSDLHKQPAFNQLKPCFVKLQTATFLMLALSTFVWAYGDVVLKKFTSASNRSTLNEGALVCLPWL